MTIEGWLVVGVEVRRLILDEQEARDLAARFGGAVFPLTRAHRQESSGVAAITAERRRQIEAEGWTPDHDDKHGRGELAGAAACYAMHDLRIPNISLEHRAVMIIRDLWPWGLSWWKPSDRRRNLVKAGALIAAEIDRLDRITG